MTRWQKQKTTTAVIILAFAAVAVLAMKAFNGNGDISGRTLASSDGHKPLIDYTADAPKPTVSYAPAEVHQPGHHHAEGEQPQRVPLHDLHLEKAMNFNAAKGEKGELTYKLNKPAMVTIRVLKEGTRELYLATIANMEYRDAGPHTETWDGRDYAGNIINMRNAFIIIQAVDASSYDPGKMKLEMKSPEEVVHSQHEWGHVHANHHEYAEEVPILNILNLHKDDVLAGKVRIETEVDKDKRGYGNQYGYGVRYYVDNTLAHEEFYKPESDGHFAYELDTTAFKDGKHTVYVGMCDHNEHTTSFGVPVVFDNSTANH